MTTTKTVPEPTTFCGYCVHLSTQSPPSDPVPIPSIETCLIIACHDPSSDSSLSTSPPREQKRSAPSAFPSTNARVVPPPKNARRVAPAHTTSQVTCGAHLVAASTTTLAPGNVSIVLPLRLRQLHRVCRLQHNAPLPVHYHHPRPLHNHLPMLTLCCLHVQLRPLRHPLLHVLCPRCADIAPCTNPVAAHESPPPSLPMSVQDPIARLLATPRAAPSRPPLRAPSQAPVSTHASAPSLCKPSPPCLLHSTETHARRQPPLPPTTTLSSSTDPCFYLAFKHKATFGPRDMRCSPASGPRQSTRSVPNAHSAGHWVRSMTKM
ncbi:hypothetical protein B0H17DRAFT_1085822 [Mycena rosella]|uniref:Uncharacterized protein n=1 Tax=Mycena rosella TaxID=1033263 RepID=A0AAD7G8P5_MYCRO|nr:hypothetical protein B0H17DRAFT_1085822 [Mycena rosella]